MSNFRLALWMGFVLALLSIAMIAFGNTEAQNAGEGILGGIGVIGFWLALCFGYF